MKYLLLALSLFAVSAHAETRAIEDWQYTKRVDAFTDEDSSYAMTSTGDGSLFVVCDEGYSYRYFPDGYVGGDFTDVDYRFDENPMQRKRVMVSSNGRMLFVHTDKDFHDGVLAGLQVVMRAKDFRGNYTGTTTFSLRGASDAIGLVNCSE